MNTYTRPVSTFWWLRKSSYLLFVLRELSSVFVAWFVVDLLLLVNAVGSGPEEYRRFLDWSARPAVLVVNGVALAFVLLHTVTWFALAPRAMVVPHVHPAVVLVAHYVVWLGLSAAVVWLVLR
jgi:fumarate reductase subunit C